MRPLFKKDHPRSRQELRELQPPLFAERVWGGWGWRAVSSPYGVAECLKISKAVPKLSERRWWGPSAVPRAGAGLSPLLLCPLLATLRGAAQS